MTRLLLDQNLSFKISKRINDIFPETKHVSDLQLSGCEDMQIWTYSKNHNFCIVSFDSDFIDISILNGFPPKIIWLRLGNSSTEAVVQKIKSNHLIIQDFLVDTENAYLEIA